MNYDDYQLRKDIDLIIDTANGIQDVLDKNNVSSLSELLSRYYDKSEIDVDTYKLNTDLTILGDDLIEFRTTLLNLRGNLIDFNEELIAFDEDNTNLADDLTKLKDNLHLFTSATQKLTTDLTDLDANLTQLDSDIDGLDNSVDGLLNAVGDNSKGLVKSMNTLQTTVGDANSGLVKQANDTSSSVTQLNTDLTSLNESLTTLTTTVGDANGGLVKELNDLDSSTESFYDDVFGQNGLASRLSSTESSLGNTNVDLQKLVYSLDKLSEYLTDFEGSLEDLEEEIEDNPNIDINRLNSDIVALFGAIGSVKSNVTVVEGDISQAQQDISDTTSSMNDVKIDLYGTKTVDGETVPKDPTDTASTNSLKSNLTTVRNTVGDSSGGLVKQANDATAHISVVQTDLYGSNKDPSNPQQGSLVDNLNTLDETINDNGGLIDQLGDVNDSIDDVNSELFGTDGQGNPLTPSDTPTATSFVGRTNAVKTDLYGNGDASNPQTGSLKDLINTVDDDINNQSTGLKVRTQDVEDTIGAVGQTGTVLDDIDKSLTDVDNLQKTMYKGATGTGTITNPASGSVMGDVDSALEQIGDTSTPNTILYDINTVQDDISDVQTDMGDVNVDVDSDLQTQIQRVLSLFKGMFPTVLEVDTLNDLPSLEYGRLTIGSGGGYRAMVDSPYEYVYVKSNQKYYHYVVINTL